jgi:hypothetical protein
MFFDMKNKEVEEIRRKLPIGSYKIIAHMMGDKYKPRTIEVMFRGVRTMKQVVLETAKKFLSTINPES